MHAGKGFTELKNTGYVFWRLYTVQLCQTQMAETWESQNAGGWQMDPLPVYYGLGKGIILIQN